MEIMRKITRKGLIRKLDKLAREIILERDSYQCVTCGSRKAPGWSHVFSRRTYNTRWDLKNGNCQCWPCNFKHVRDQFPYFEWFKKEYGANAFLLLRKKFDEVHRWTMQDLKDKLEELEDLL